MNKYKLGETVWATMVGTIDKIENMGTTEKPRIRYSVSKVNNGVCNICFVEEVCLAPEEKETL